MTRATIEIPDKLQAALEKRLAAEQVTLEQKIIQLLRQYAEAATLEEQLKAGRFVMDRYGRTLQNLAK